MKTVKLTFPPEHWQIEKYLPDNSFCWGDYKFILNQDIKECDYWIVFGNLIQEKEKTIIKPANVIFITSESADIVEYPAEFLNQFHTVSSFRKDMKHDNVINTVPVIPWFVKKNFDELKALKQIPKTKKISLLASDKKISVNHIKRLNFVKKIHKYFGSEIDIYGAGLTDQVFDKTPTHDPYMFTIVLETISVPEYFSEKLGDSYLSLCFTIYYGCSNISTYFDPKSFELIDINDFDRSVKTIKNVLDSEKLYESRLEKLVEAKNKYLDEYSLFPVMVDILNKIAVINDNAIVTQKEQIIIRKFEQKKDLKYIIKRANTLAYNLIASTK